MRNKMIFNNRVFIFIAVVSVMTLLNVFITINTITQRVQHTQYKHELVSFQPVHVLQNVTLQEDLYVTNHSTLDHLTVLENVYVEESLQISDHLTLNRSNFDRFQYFQQRYEIHPSLASSSYPFQVTFDSIQQTITVKHTCAGTLYYSFFTSIPIVSFTLDDHCVCEPVNQIVKLPTQTSFSYFRVQLQTWFAKEQQNNQCHIRLL